MHNATQEPGAHAGIDGIELVDKVIQIDQSAIGRTPRSNPATYTGMFTFVRELYSMLPEARAPRVPARRFSFNVKGGRCEACQGDGLIAVEMHFLPDVYVTCEQCKGRRYNRETLEIKYRGVSVAEMLDLTVDQALPLLENFPSIATKLRTLKDVGLGYVTLGQPATTLSGGEAQRVKLAKELSRRSTGRTLYILDEPTTGLHLEDTRHLLEVLDKLVEQGNSVVVDRAPARRDQGRRPRDRPGAGRWRGGGEHRRRRNAGGGCPRRWFRHRRLPAAPAGPGGGWRQSVGCGTRATVCGAPSVVRRPQSGSPRSGLRAGKSPQMYVKYSRCTDGARLRAAGHSIC